MKNNKNKNFSKKHTHTHTQTHISIFEKLLIASLHSFRSYIMKLERTPVYTVYAGEYVWMYIQIFNISNKNFKLNLI